jgi:hypothetical protein
MDSAHFDNDALMRMWRYAVITHLRAALKAHVLKSDLDAHELQVILTAMLLKGTLGGLSSSTNSSQSHIFCDTLRVMPVARTVAAAIQDDDIPGAESATG